MSFRKAGAACAALLGAFATLSYGTALTKNATFDEPYHLFASWVFRFQGDYRVAYDHPPLWTYWASLPMSRDSMHVDVHSPEWDGIAENYSRQVEVSTRAVFSTPGIQAEPLLQRSRAAMVLLGVALGVIVAVWAGQIGGALAALFATALFALDPNFLAHAPLIKNDTAIALILVSLMFATWRLGQRATVWNVAATALLCGAGLGTKFSAMLFGPMITALLVTRALLATPWPVFGHPIRSRPGRLAMVSVVLISCLATSMLVVWASYRFRFDPSSDSSIRFQTDDYLYTIRARLAWSHHPDHQPTDAEILATALPLRARALSWMNSHHVMPSAWIHGLFFVDALSQVRPSFLLGRVALTGVWYYFPFALLVKLPIATLAAVAIGIWLLLARFLRGGYEMKRFWNVACFVTPVGLYLVGAMTSNLNIGIRHALPILPFLYIAAGVGAAAAIRQFGRPAVMGAIVLASMLAVETASATPDFLAFFNAAAGGSRGGLALLGDSNLDWGQDIRSLARWQQGHDDRPLYLSYFSPVDPSVYGVRYRPLPGEASLHGPQPDWPHGPAYVAISATNLQGIYSSPELRAIYHRFEALRPLEVLGGTIYIYETEGD